MKVIEVNGLHKTFKTLITRKKVHALRGMDLTVNQGEIVGLLGPNGAGKTTLVKILLGICYGDDGEARLFGEPCKNAKSRHRVGYLPENHKYPTYLKGKHVMDYYAKLSGMNKAQRDERIGVLLEQVRMDKWKDTKMGKYSKGMGQRVGLAVAMVSDPDLLVLDEPTDGVDPIGRKEIRDVLNEFKNRGKTIFLNSHLLGEVEQICDKIIVVNKGKVITSGSVAELTAEGSIWSIEIENMPESYYLNLKDKGINATVGGENLLLVDVPNTVVLNDVIDAVRGENLLIKGIKQKRSSLEDLFIDVIRKEEGEMSVQ